MNVRRLSLLFLLVALPSAAQQRLFVDRAATAGGDGSEARPFTTLEAAQQGSADGDTIVIRAGSHTGGLTLKSGQTLMGEGTVAGIVKITYAGGTVTIRDVTIGGLVVKKAAKLVVANAKVAATDATAIDIADAELDASFASVSARGKYANAISLERTTGRFTIAGKDGESGSGGTIDGATTRAVSAVAAANVTLRWMNLTNNARENGVAPTDCGTGKNDKCNAAVYLRNVAGATLEGVLIDGSRQAGLVAHRVKDLRVLNCEIRGAGDETFEHGIVLQELSGNCQIAASKIHHNASRQLMLRNETGALNLAVTHTRFSDGAAPHGAQGVLITTAGDAQVDLTVRDSVFARNHSHALDVIAEGSSHVKVAVRASTFDRNAAAISLSAGESATLDYVIADNPSITGATTSAINIFLAGASRGRLSGTIANNVIGKQGEAGSGAKCGSCSGVSLTGNGSGFLVAHVTGNTIQQVDGGGVRASAGEGSSSMDVTIANNTFREPAGSSPAIRVQSGTLTTDKSRVCADVRGNKIAGTWEPNGAIHLIHRFGGTQFRLAGLTGGNTDTAAAAHIGKNNGSVMVRAALRPDAAVRGFESADRCTMPATQ